MSYYSSNPDQMQTVSNAQQETCCVCGATLGPGSGETFYYRNWTPNGVVLRAIVGWHCVYSPSCKYAHHRKRPVDEYTLKGVRTNASGRRTAITNE